MITCNDKEKISCFGLYNYKLLYETKNIKLKIDSNDTYIIEATPTTTGSFKGVDLSNTTANYFKINDKSLS